VRTLLALLVQTYKYCGAGAGAPTPRCANLLALLAQKVQILTRRKARAGANQSRLRVRAQIREEDGAAGAGTKVRALLALLALLVASEFVLKYERKMEQLEQVRNIYVLSVLY
jgi:hypothetical protein